MMTKAVLKQQYQRFWTQVRHEYVLLSVLDSLLIFRRYCWSGMDYLAKH